MLSYKRSRVILNNRRRNKIFKYDAEIFKSGDQELSIQPWMRRINFLPLFPSLLGVTLSSYTVPFYAEWRYLGAMGLYLALSPLAICFFLSAILYFYYGSARHAETHNIYQKKTVDHGDDTINAYPFCIPWRKSWIPILVHLVGIVAVVLICLGLNEVLSACDWVVLFIPLYIMDFLIASFIIKPSKEECCPRLLVAFLTWASGSTFLVLLALQLNNINLRGSILFIPMYFNVVVLIPYIFYWGSPVKEDLCLSFIFSLSVALLFAFTIVMVVLRLELVLTPSWPVCMCPLMVLTTTMTIFCVSAKLFCKED
jgi:hypothetical protein